MLHSLPHFNFLAGPCWHNWSWYICQFNMCLQWEIWSSKGICWHPACWWKGKNYSGWSSEPFSFYTEPVPPTYWYLLCLASMSILPYNVNDTDWNEFCFPGEYFQPVMSGMEKESYSAVRYILHNVLLMYKLFIWKIIRRTLILHIYWIKNIQIFILYILLWFFTGCWSCSSKLHTCPFG